MKKRVYRADLSGVMNVPGSKSHTIRACLFAALAEGESKIKNPLPSEDCLSALAAIQQFGASVEEKENLWSVKGAGRNFHLPEDVVNVGNSGSVLYFFTPVASVMDGYSVFTGDSSIRTRPVKMMLDALGQLGVESIITRAGKDAPPIVVRGPLKPGTVETPGKPSQYVSGILIAASLVDGITEIHLSDPKETPYLQMTIDWMNDLGVKVEYTPDYRKLKVKGPFYYKAFDRVIPGDWEAAAFPMLAGLVTDSIITIEDIDCSGSQGDQEVAEIMKKMGGDIILDSSASRVIIKGGNPLYGIEVNCASIPDAIPALAVLAVFASGTTRLMDIGVCRLKETDRINLMESQLKKLGVNVRSTEDSLEIEGLAKPGETPLEAGRRIKGGEIETFKDHRVAMAFASGGLALEEDSALVINDAQCCGVSFPGFFEAMERVGGRFSDL